MSVKIDTRYVVGETRVTVDTDGGDVAIHPWRRVWEGETHADVYVEVNVLGDDGNVDDDLMANVIVDREEFVTAILAAFPELVRA